MAEDIKWDEHANRGCHGILRDDENMYSKGHCPLRFKCFRFRQHELRPRPPEWKAMGPAPYNADTEECPKYWKV